MFACTLSFLGAALLALVVTPWLARGARRLKLVDAPNERTVHWRPIPRIGGIAFVAATLILTAVAFAVDGSLGQGEPGQRSQIAILLTAAAGLFLVGLADDVRSLSPVFKLACQTALALAVCACGARIRTFSLGPQASLDLGLLSWPVTLLWMVGMTNAVNLIDGLDGLAAGISVIACGVIALFAACTGQAAVAVVMLALSGALAGFLIFNFNPARIFMGDCGSMFLGFVLAGVSVISTESSHTLAGLAMPALALGIPIFDTGFSIVRRLAQHRSIFSPDRGHIHHRLLGLGLRQRHAVVLLYVLSLASATLGLLMLNGHDWRMLAIFGCVWMLLATTLHMAGITHLAFPVRENLADAGGGGAHGSLFAASPDSAASLAASSLPSRSRRLRIGARPVIAICHRPGSFSDRWLEYARRLPVDVKPLDPYASDAIDQLRDCHALLWHWAHFRPADVLMARQLIWAARSMGLETYPDPNTCASFDDKIAQKYQLEAIGAPLVNSYVFYDLDSARRWIDQARFPKVFKLRCGAGARNVRLVRSAPEAYELARRAFGKGFAASGAMFADAGRRWQGLRRQRGLAHALAELPAKLRARRRMSQGLSVQRGYLYLQDFLPGNSFDTRITVIGRRALGFIRHVRPGDFRASGSGLIDYDPRRIDPRCVRIGFDVAQALGAQSLALDFLFAPDGQPQISEISYGFSGGANLCQGYWDPAMLWHQGPCRTEDAILDDLLERVRAQVRADAPVIPAFGPEEFEARQQKGAA